MYYINLYRDIANTSVYSTPLIMRPIRDFALNNKLHHYHSVIQLYLIWCNCSRSITSTSTAIVDTVEVPTADSIICRCYNQLLRANLRNIL